MRFAEGLAAVLLTSACASERRDFENLCHAHERAGLQAGDDAAARAVKISRWLAETLKTEAAKQALARLATLDPSVKARALSEVAARHGVSPCPIAAVTWPSSDAGR
jgi:hypothetical protein